MQVESGLNAISIDVEEWYQTTLINGNNFSNTESTSLLKNIDEILSLFEECNTKATFFIVGSVVKQYPDIVRMIAERGHELASHGYFHKLVYRMSKQEFSRDLALSLDVLRESAQTNILGYRAPTWSIINDAHWAVDILQAAGLRYDSSIYPFSFNLIKSRKLERFPYKINDNFIEFPPSTFKFLNYNLPFCGGMFLRNFPLSFIKNKIIEINAKGHPAMVYLHSWEFDSQAAKFKIPNWKRLIQYSNIGSVKGKLLELLQSFKFTSIKEVLQLR
ncbi:MAG: polysaccharide deacetylase family protein [Candidatus Omnitrophica bacterium]|nr:polysaccharide deacetylase family protein [Candidatus Omnitrophota bacterium]